MMLRACPILGAMLAAMCGCSGDGPSVSARSNPWFAAATSGGHSQLDAAKASGANINEHERGDYNTPLHVAAIAGNVEAVRYLLANGADVNAVDEDGRTALMMALHNSQGPAAVALVEGNANLEARDRQRNSAAMFAARRGQVDAIRAMSAKGVQLDAQNASGKAALHFAAEHGQIEAARALRAAGASTLVRDDRGRTPLDYAVAKKDSQMATILQ